MVQCRAMIRIITPTLVVVLALSLAACASRGGPPKRIHPPAASIQEVAVQADGSWRVLLRVQSFSTVGTDFQRIDLALVIDDVPAGRLDYGGARTIPGQAAEVFRLSLVPEADAAAALAAFSESGRGSLVWSLSGVITVDGRNFRNRFEGRLSPVPGLTDTYR
jgi:hypothetical protein